MQPTTRKGIAPFVGVAIVAALLVGLGGGILAGPSLLGSPASITYKPTPETKEFVVFTNIAGFNETENNLLHDYFSPSTITVNQGDTVVIHFYNVEDEPEHHNFVITAYGVNVDLAPGQHQDITFTATQAGVFRFYCAYHQPTMSGQLIVLPTSS